MNNKQKLLTATAITGTIVSASAFTVFDYAICRRKKQPDVRKKEKWKPYLDYVLKEQRRKLLLFLELFTSTRIQESSSSRELIRDLSMYYHHLRRL